MDESLLLQLFLHPAYEDPEMDNVLVGVQVVGVAYHVLEVGAYGEGEVHHKTELEVV